MVGPRQRSQWSRASAHEQHLRRLAFISMRWSPAVLTFHGWEHKGRDFIFKLHQCAKKYPHYRHDFVPQANLVIWLKHCAGVSIINEGRTTNKDFAGNDGHFAVKDLTNLMEIHQTRSIKVYGTAVTTSTASERQEDISRWTQSQDGRVVIHGTTVDLRAWRPGHWNTFLLKFDQTGLLTRRDESDSVNVTNTYEAPLSLHSAPNPGRSVLRHTNNDGNYGICEYTTTTPTPRAEGMGNQYLRFSDSHMGTSRTKTGQATPSTIHSPVPSTAPSTQEDELVTVSPHEDIPYEEAMAREATGHAQVRDDTANTGVDYRLDEEATTDVQLSQLTPLGQGHSSKQDDTNTTTVELGKYARRARRLKAWLRQLDEQKMTLQAQYTDNRDGFITLQSRACEMLAECAERDARVQTLRRQVEEVERQAAERWEQAEQTKRETDGKGARCKEYELSAANAKLKCADINKKLQEIVKGLGID